MMAERIPRSLIRQFATRLNQTCKKGRTVAGDLVSAYIKENPNATIAEIRDFAISVVTDAAQLYGDAAATLELQLFDWIRVPDAQLYGGPDKDAIGRGVRYQIQKLVDGDQDAFLDGIEELADYHIRNGANQTGINNVKRANNASKRRTNVRIVGGGNGLRYARVPTGLETCTFCVMLASRGFAYLDETSAGHANHRGCNCLIVPGIPGKTTIDGYEPNVLRELWHEYEEIDGHLPQDEEGEILTGASKERALRAMKREALQEILGRDTFDAE